MRKRNHKESAEAKSQRKKLQKLSQLEFPFVYPQIQIDFREMKKPQCDFHISCMLVIHPRFLWRIFFINYILSQIRLPVKTFFRFPSRIGRKEGREWLGKAEIDLEIWRNSFRWHATRKDSIIYTAGSLAVRKKPQAVLAFRFCPRKGAFSFQRKKTA